MVSRRRFLLAATVATLLPARAGAQAAREAALLSGRRHPKWLNPLPNPLSPDWTFSPDQPGGNSYTVEARAMEQLLGLAGQPGNRRLATRLWGYATPSQAPTSPGRSFVVRRGTQIRVRWVNRLANDRGEPLPHLLPVDTTLHWADPLAAGHVAGPYLGPVPLVSHLHGANAESASDGLPDAWAGPVTDNDALPALRGRQYSQTYHYDNRQEAALLWYHDHALGITRLNVYAGLAGNYIIRDENEDALIAAGALPAYPYELPLLLQDRRFTADGQLFFPHTDPENRRAPNPTHLPEMFGDVVLVNGTAWPQMEVEPRPYRLRLLNGADSRFFELRLTGGLSFVQIGTDLGMMNAPVRVQTLLLAPGERADVVVDFSARGAGLREVFLTNRARAPYPKGELPEAGTTDRLLAFRIVKALNAAVPPARIPANLRPVHGPLPVPPPARRTRKLLLHEGRDHYGRLQTMLGIIDPGNPNDGTLFWSDPVTETPQLGDTEIWEIHNATADAHPIHLHLTGFRILDRQAFRGRLVDKPMPHGSTGARLDRIRLTGKPRPPAANEAGMKDTAVALPGEVTRLVATFDRAGDYVWHCHILSHEDHEMMRPLRVLP